MKWINIASLLVLVVILGVVYVFYLKITTMDQNMKGLPEADEMEYQLQSLKEDQARLRGDMNKALSAIWERLNELEAGRGEQELAGPKSSDYLLAHLEIWIHRKRDAAMMPDQEMAAQNKIEELIQELEIKAREGDDIITLMLERIKISNEPYNQEALLRDVVWRFGPGAMPGLMELFRDRDFTPNLRNLAAYAAMQSGGDQDELLDEFTLYLGDPKELMTIKTVLVRNIFRVYPHEGAVDLLIQGAKDPGYHEQHRIECLRALQIYDHPKVIRELEEIITNEENDSFIIVMAIHAYSTLMREKSVPFLKGLRDQGKVNPNTLELIKNILEEHEKKANSSR
jgi:hypothetical protein